MEKKHLEEITKILDHLPFLRTFSVENKVKYNLFLEHFSIKFRDFQQFIYNDPFTKEANDLGYKLTDTIEAHYFLKWAYTLDTSQLKQKQVDDFLLFLKYATYLLHNAYDVYDKIEELKEAYQKSFKEFTEEMRVDYSRKIAKLTTIQEKITTNLSITGKLSVNKKFRKEDLLFSERTKREVTRLILDAFEISNEHKIRCSTNVLYHALNHEHSTKLVNPVDKAEIKRFMRSKGYHNPMHNGAVRFPIELQEYGGIIFLNIDGKIPQGRYYILDKKYWL